MPRSRKFIQLPALVCLAALAIGALGGCASLAVRKKDATLPIHIQPSGIGRIQARAWKSDSHLYVSGTFRKAFGIQHPYDLRVRIILEDAGGGALQAEEDRIPPTSPRRASSGQAGHSFVVKFPLSEIPEARVIRVILQRGGKS